MTKMYLNFRIHYKKENTIKFKQNVIIGLEHNVKWNRDDGHRHHRSRSRSRSSSSSPERYKHRNRHNSGSSSSRDRDYNKELNFVHNGRDNEHKSKGKTTRNL